MAEPTMAETLERVQAENHVLNRIIEVLFSGSDLDEVLSSTTALILEAVSADACFLHLIDEEHGGLVLRAASDPFRDMVGQVRLRIGEGVAGWVTEHRVSAVIPDKWSDDRYRYIPELGGERFSSLASVPLICPSGRLIGAFNIHTIEPRDFTAGSLAFLEHVGSMVAAAIEHASLFREVVDKERALQAMVERTVQAQEEERRRIATEIHDGVTQHLISMWYRLNACERLLDKDVSRARVELGVAKELIDEALAEARGAIYDLRPTTLDDLGLVAALDALVGRTLGPDVEFTFVPDVSRPLPPHLETALYRMAQEAIANIRKHAEASVVQIDLEWAPGEVVMRVTDNGKGFDVQAQARAPSGTSFGLMGLRERVTLVRGKLTIDSAPGRGTRIEVRVPIKSTALLDLDGRAGGQADGRRAGSDVA
ncbi:MAG: GAF domain-containing sensor histidine kinase [Actinomycetota bacterium]